MVTLGGDHTIAYPLLRATNAVHGQVALVHFDAHVDTYDTYMGAPFTHGTPFRRAAEEELFARDHSMHVGIRGSKYGPEDLGRTQGSGSSCWSTWEIDRIGIDGYVQRHPRAGRRPAPVPVDRHRRARPGVRPGDRHAGGRRVLSSRELLGILRGLRGLQLVGGDIVEVSPPFDHAEITSIAAANVAYELVSLMAP